MNAKTHWEHIYESKAPTKVSWYQEHAQISLQFIQRAGIQKTDHIIDVGGGASTLVDDLLAAGYQRVTVLDVSAKALELARGRLGELAANVNWIEADITQADLPEGAYALWHDRAVFHFLTQPFDRQRYIETARRDYHRRRNHSKRNTHHNPRHRLRHPPRRPPFHLRPFLARRQIAQRTNPQRIGARHRQTTRPRARRDDRSAK